MSAILVRLTPQSLEATWPRISEMVAAACERSHGRYTAPLILGYAGDGRWQLWIAVDDRGICAVTGTEIVTYDTGLKVLAIRFGTGREREKWQHFMDEVLVWAKYQGCTLAEGSFRRGWKRVLPNWLHTHDTLERAL